MLKVDFKKNILTAIMLIKINLNWVMAEFFIQIRELKQTDAAAVNRQIFIEIQSDGYQGPTEFTWPLSPSEWKFAGWPPPHQFA